MKIDQLKHTVTFDESEYHKMIEGEFLKGDYRNWTDFEKQCLRDSQALVKDGVCIEGQRVADVLIGMRYMFNKLICKTENSKVNTNSTLNEQGCNQ